MLDEIIDVFIERIRKKVLSDKKMTHVPLAYLMTLDIPQSIKHFFDQEVELWIREEEEKFSSSDRFNYDMPEIRVLIDQIFDLLKQTAQFDLAKFNQLLERAVKLQMNFVIEPHRTLTQFLFKDRPVISTIEVYDTLKYFFQLEYYKEAISEYFNTKYLKTISQDQFIELLNKIDEKVFGENRVEMTLKTLKTIMTFLSEAQGTKVTSLPVNVLYAALRDRNLNDLAEKIEQAQKEIQVSELSFEMIESILFERFTQPEEAPEEVVGFDEIQGLEEEDLEIPVNDIDVGESSEEALAEFDEQLAELEMEEEEDDEDDEYEEDEEEEELETELKLEEGPSPSEMETAEVPETEPTFEESEPETPSYEEPAVVEPPRAEETEPKPEMPVEETVPSPMETSETEATDTEQKASKVADDLAEHLAKQIASEGPLEDLNNMIKGRTRKKIIKKLFKKDEQAFNEFIAKLNAISTWKEASHFIDDTFYERNINPYSKEAIMFSDIVYMRYFPKDKYIGSNFEEERFS